MLNVMRWAPAIGLLLFAGTPLGADDGPTEIASKAKRIVAKKPRDIPPGYRVVSVKVERSKNREGLLRPGDHVDVVLNVPTADARGRVHHRPVSIVENVKVFAIDSQGHVSLLVKSTPGNLLLRAESSGKLILAQRDGDKKQKAPEKRSSLLKRLDVIRDEAERARARAEQRAKAAEKSRRIAEDELQRARDELQRQQAVRDKQIAQQREDAQRRRALEEKREKLRRQSEAAQQQAEARARQLQALRDKKLVELDRLKRGSRPGPREAAAMMEKLEHVRAAAMHLKAAGMDDLARVAAARGEKLEAALHGLREKQGPHDRAVTAQMREMTEMLQRLQKQVQQLQQSVQKLQRRK